MGFMEMFQRRNSGMAVQPRTVMITLTPLGKQKLEGFAVSGGNYRVMAEIEDGPKPLSEIAARLHARPEQVKAIVQNLAEMQYVRIANQGTM